MNFLVFRRADSALMVVPDMFQPPVACGDPKELWVVGRCQLDLALLSARTVADLGLRGFALVDGEDLAIVRRSMQTMHALRELAAQS